MNPLIELRVVPQDGDDTDSEDAGFLIGVSGGVVADDVVSMVNNDEVMGSDGSGIEMHAEDCAVDCEVEREEVVDEDVDDDGDRVPPRLPIVEYQDDVMVVKCPPGLLSGMEECDCNSYNCFSQDLVSVETGLEINPTYLSKNVGGVYLAQQRMMERYGNLI